MTAIATDRRQFLAGSGLVLGLVLPMRGAKAMAPAGPTFAPNAFVGVGLANLYGRKKRGDARIADPPVRSKKPAVTFVLKF